jgi:hypothetical protein
MFEQGWKSGLPHTVCGSGSLPENTVGARMAIPRWVRQYGIRTVVDAGAGDMKWKAGMTLDAEYRAFDYVPRAEGVTQIDVVTEALPKCDLIICRLVLNHVGQNHALRALDLFRKSGKYLAATQFDVPREKGRYDLREWLGPYLEAVPDGGDDDCMIALWELNDG